jgi:hypothetical protein
MNRLERASVWAGPLAVGLWIAGIFLVMHNDPSDHATDAQILTWYKSNANWVLTGGWLFMVGCLVFIWFAGALRGRLAEAEGGTGTFAAVGFAGAVATAAFGVLTPAGDVAAAINKNDISAATAGTFHRFSDAFFVGAELSAIVLLAAVAVLSWRTSVLPRWWGTLGALVAVVLVIGPIGWAGLIFGLPLWTLGTSLLLARRPGVRRQAPATA